MVEVRERTKRKLEENEKSFPSSCENSILYFFMPNNFHCVVSRSMSQTITNSNINNTTKWTLLLPVFDAPCPWHVLSLCFCSLFTRKVPACLPAYTHNFERYVRCVFVEFLKDSSTQLSSSSKYWKLLVCEVSRVRFSLAHSLLLDMSGAGVLLHIRILKSNSNQTRPMFQMSFICQTFVTLYVYMFHVFP